MAAQYRPSVLNPQPQRLPGPGLLHHLLFGAETDLASSDYFVSRRSGAASGPALDYQAPNGQRTVFSYSQLHQKAQLLASEISRRQLKASEASASPGSGDAGSLFLAGSQDGDNGHVVPPKDMVVPVLIPQAPELYLSLLAILKAGGAFCPIQLDAPSERIRFILGDVSAAVVLTTEEMASKLPQDLAVEVVLVDQLHLLDFDDQNDGQGTSQAETPPAWIPTEDDLAYVMYTSGSTGTPKGVGVPHIAATQSLLSHDRHIPPFERFLQFAAPTFDVSVFEIFFPLFRGATLVSCSRAEMLSDLPAIIRGMNVDACELTPTVAGSLLRSRDNAPGLRLLLTIGEMLTEPVVREFGFSDGRPSILWAMYGPTEAAIHCTLQPALDGAASVKNIGFPLDTVSAYVVEIPTDGQLVGPGDPKIVPMGDVGELAVGGYQLARGYINRPEQTAAAFIDTDKFGRLYRTGDKARITEEGILECSGRLSGGQVKLRGQRIELGEIEQAVLRADGCLGSAATVINGNLVAFCDAGPNAEANMEQKVLESCKSWLPRFMIPGDFVIMPEFPRLASGKVDRRRLADQYADLQRLASASMSFQPPDFEDDLDRLLHEIARDILGCDIESSFPLAAAGVDSLQSIRFAASIRFAGFHNVSAIDVLEAKTLSSLRARIRRLKEDAEQTSDVLDAADTRAADVRSQSARLDVDTVFSAAPVLHESIDRDYIDFISECNSIQAAMLSETLANPQAYCNWIELQFAGQHGADEIASCFHRVIEQNEALRTGFVHFDGRFVQVVWKQAAPKQVEKVGSPSRDYLFDTEQSFFRAFHVEVFDTEPSDTGRSVRAVLHLHHAVYDGWSADLIRTDLESMLEGGDVAARPPYSRVVEHNLSISADENDAAKQFWAQLLNGYQPSPLPELRLRTDEPVGTSSKSVSLAAIDSALVEKISQKLEYGTQTIFQAALAWLWSSLIGSNDVVIGTVASGRTLPIDGIEGVIGPCLQTVPLRTNLSQMRTIHDLLSSIQSTNRALLPHAFLPLAEIKKTAGLRPGQPLYDVLFVYQESLYSQRTSRDLVSEVAHKDYLETKLLWEIEPVDDKFHIHVTFHGDVFPGVQVDVMMEQYRCVIHHLANDMDKELTTIRSCFPQELLSCYNMNHSTFSGCADLAQLFQETARQHPSRPAVCFANSIRDGDTDCQILTYHELDRLSNRIARYLQSNGAAPGDIVPIILDKSIYLYAGILGILKAGCAYLPLLPTVPLARARMIIQQAGIRLCLTNTAAAASLVSHLPAEFLDLQSASLDSFSDSTIEGVPIDPARPAYIIYTSGSTGAPKGVSVTQLSIASNLDVLARIYLVKDDGRLLQSCSQVFDVSVFEIFFTWKTGMCLCSAINDVLFDDLERAIRLLEVTHLSMTPTVASLVNPTNTPSVEIIVVAGEPLLESVLNMWWSKGLYAGYGPTETTNIVTIKNMTSRSDIISQLGHSLETTSAFVLHLDSIEPVAKGALGELCFGGDQVAVGYLQLPSVTAERFIEHPSFGRIYRTGDVGRMLPDGSLSIVGRIDDQIKLRGQRIELSEINSVLQESGLVTEPITLLLRQGDTGSELLASFFTPSRRDTLGSTLSTVYVPNLSDESPSPSSIISQLFCLLKSQLPAYMVPTHLIPISSIPLTPAGKTDKQALKDLFRSLSLADLSSTSNSVGNDSGGDEESAQWSEVEENIARITSEALKVDVRAIGRWTPLPSLGLDSISAIRLSKLMHQSLQRRFLISDILKNASVARLAQVLGDGRSSRDLPSVYSLALFSPGFLSELQQTLDTRGLAFSKVLPCTPLQEGMLVSPTRGKSYINSMLFRLHMHPDQLRSSWMNISGRQEILRTCFVTTDTASHPIAQVVLETWKPSWLEYGTQEPDSEGPAVSLQSLVNQHVESLADPVDSLQPPVSFAVIYQPHGCFLSFVCHHAIYDGEAMEHLLFEVEQTAKGAALPPINATFDSFLAQALSLPQPTETFWKEHLADFKPALLRNESSASPRQSSISTHTIGMPLSKLQERSQHLGVSLLTTLQSVWSSVLCLLGEADDVCFGNVYNGRSLPLDGVDELVAPCFNTLPVRVQTSTLRTVKDLMSYFQSLNPDMMRYQFTPLRHIQRKYTSFGGRLFDSLLLLQKPTRPLDIAVWTLELDDGEMDFPLVCELAPDPSQDSLIIRIHYDSQLVSDDAALLVSELFENLVESFLLFSSSQIPCRGSLPPQLRQKMSHLELYFDRPAPVTHEDRQATAVSLSAEDWNATESIIRSVLSNLSEVPESQIRRSTTLYRLGLDSVRAVQVAARLRKQGLPVSAVDVMEYPSSMDLANFLAKASATVSEASALISASDILSTVSSPASSPAEYDFSDLRARLQPLLDKYEFSDKDVEAVLPCTPLQSSLLAEFYRSSGRHYFNFVTLRAYTDAAMTLTALSWARAWEQVAVTTPMLRTGFLSVEDDSITDIQSPFAMVQLSTLAATAHYTRISLIRKQDQPLFSLTKWRLDATKHAFTNIQVPPWQVAVVEDPDGTGLTCHLAIHHGLYDATSLSAIFENVSRCASGSPSRRASQTETVVSEILHQITSSMSSDISEAWKSLAARAVTNTFPTLTPLKVTSPLMKVATTLSRKSFNELFDAAKNSGFTLHAVLQAAWARILSSYIGDSNVVFGTVLSGRSSEATADAVFPCLTTLPVVAENQTSNRRLVEQMLSFSVLLQKSQHVPLNQIQKWLGRAESRLFDTLLVYQNIGRHVGAEDVIQPWKIVDEEALVDYAISLEAIPQTGGAMQYQITFDDSIIPNEQVQLLLRQFDATVCHIVLHPDSNEDELVTTEPNIFSAVPAKEPELQSDVNLMHQFVELQARTIPHKTALQFVTTFDSTGRPVSKDWTYAELNQRGNAVAAIVSQHANVGSIVSVCFDKCAEAFFAILGILKAGCSFVALDPGAPPTRKEFILQDSKAALLLTDRSRASRTSSATGLFDSAIGVPIVGIDDFSLASQNVPDSDIGFSVSGEILPSDNCYCLYTSGTTGTPKGCAITHENAVQAMLAFQELFRNHYDENSRWLQFASFHFDVSVLEQYWTWSVGVVLVSAPRDLILEDLAGTISRLNITHIDLTPSLGRLLDPKEVPSLCRGVFITGGEPLKQEMLDPWGPTGAVHNFYGPTEATIGVTSYPQVPQNGRASNIGRQFPNVGTFVFRPGTQTPVLRGAVGELCVSGKLVGKGYLNREDLTNERFPTLSDKSYPGYGERIYRTGDLVRLLHDGCFDFLGRADDQVKLRGQRLEIGEINHAIRLGVGSSISDVATLVIRDETNKKDFLASFVVILDASTSSSAIPRNGLPLEPQFGEESASLSRQVQVACRERLPGYMVPTYVVQLPFIPLSSNNKAEAKELRRIFNSLAPEDRMRTTGAGGSSDQIELSASFPGKELLAVLRQLSLLGKDEGLMPNSSIFELGIDSISVLRFARALKQAGLPATPSLILSHPVIDDLISALKIQKDNADFGPLLEARLLVEACQHRSRGVVCEALAISLDDIEYIAPCSALQQGMVSRSRSGQEDTQAYFNKFSLKLARNVSVERLREAWEVVMQRNAILRTRFVVTNDGVVQVALKAPILPWNQVSCEDGRYFAEAMSEYHTLWVSSNGGDVFSSPVEFFVGESQGDSYLVVHIFHGLYDAISLDLILGQVAASYDGELEVDREVGSTSFLEALIHGPLRSYGNSRPFWEAHLKESVFSPLPILVSSEERTKDASVKRTVSFDAINSLCVSLGVTHSALIQALWVAALQQTYGGGTTLGLVLSGRASTDLDHVESVIGPLFNTLPFYMPRIRHDTWASLAKKCHAFNTAILPFQQVPLRDVQKWCSAGQPLFDILFSFQFADSSSSEQKIWTEADSSTQADYALALEAVLYTADNGASQVEFLLVAKAGVADEAVVDQIIDRLVSAVGLMAKNSQSLVFTAEGGDATMPEETNSMTENSGGGNTIELGADNTSTLLSTFDWEGDAAKIRQELVLLSSAALDSIHENTTLLELGLDSVDTIKLSARLRELGIRLTNSQLIRGQCISEFLKTIAGAASDEGNGKAGGTADKSVALVKSVSTSLKAYLARSGRDLSSVDDVLPPTPLQEGLVADMIQSGFTRYFNHDVLELKPETDLDQLKTAWINTIKANPILRTVFYVVDSPDFDMSYCQIVKHDADTEDMIADYEASNQDELVRFVEKARERATKSQGESGLLQLTFVHILTQPSRYLVLSIAHSLYDGWSLELMHRRVESAYRNITNGIAHLEPRSTYLQQLGDILYSSGSQSESFWRSFLANSRPTHVKPIMSDHASLSASKSVTRLETASTVSAADLLSFCREKATSAQVVGQACWAAVLATQTGSLDVVFGVVLSGRDTEGAEEIMFPTMNTVPVRVVLHGTTSELLQYMQSNMGSITENQHFPLRKAQKMVAKPESTGESGAFNTLFIFQKRSKQQLSASGLAEEDSRPLMQSIEGVSDVEYPICVEMEVVSASSSETIVWRMAYDSSYVSSSEANRLVHELDTALSFFTQSSSATPNKDNVLRFEEGGISLCGLPAFSPSLAREAESQKSHASLLGPPSRSWSETEEVIRSTLSAVSGVPLTSIERRGQTLYHLGLDSISAIKVSSLLKKTRNISLGVRELLAADSIEDMAAIARAKAKQPHHNSNDGEAQSTASISTILASVQADAVIQAAGISSEEVQHVLPATAMQVHMVSVWQASNGEVFFPEFHYHLSGVSGGREAIFAAWKTLVFEYQILRTVLLATEFRVAPVLQVVLKPFSSEQPQIDEQIWPALEKHMPLAFLSVMPRTEHGSFVLALKIHHALYDAVSLKAILNRFQYLCGSAAPVPAAPVNGNMDAFAPWMQVLAQQVSESTKHQQREFWTRYFQPAVKDTPESKHVPASHQSGRVSLFKEAVLSDITTLRATASKHGLSLQSLLFAAYAKALCMDRGTSDAIFGIYLANRANEAEESGKANGLVQYPTLCLVPLLVPSPAQRSLADMAQQIQGDIHAISMPPAPSSPAPATVGLWDIQDWTGVEVDSFVNFLLPDENMGTDSGDVSDVSLESIAPLADSSMMRVADAAFFKPESYGGLVGNCVKGAYKDAVDFEVAVRRDRLDMGVFGSHAYLGANGADELIIKVVSILQETSIKE